MNERSKSGLAGLTLGGLVAAQPHGNQPKEKTSSPLELSGFILAEIVGKVGLASLLFSFCGLRAAAAAVLRKRRDKREEKKAAECLFSFN